ncbi:MAG TPA: hypothetical protein VMW47_01560 [Verrucomicrobiae bacterium]|nr:hypothetical protein [Verrucomicrobiae bacterium]
MTGPLTPRPCDGPRPARPPQPLAVSSRTIQLGLGGLWLLDGALQLQPAMFGRGFVYAITVNDVMEQPTALAHALTSVVGIAEPHLVVFNSLFAATQLAIGLGMLYRPTVRVAILASIAWGLWVWMFGEGLGGLFTGLASLPTGAPGPVLLYPLIGLVAWPVGHPPERPGRHRRAGWVGERGARIVWAGLWLGGAFLQLQPSYPFWMSLGSAFAASAAPAPLAALDQVVWHLAVTLGEPLTVGLAVWEAAIGLTVLRRFHSALFLRLGIVTSVVFWVAGQNLGGVLSGTATDPSSGPLFVLLALSLLPAARSSNEHARAGSSGSLTPA